jgi:predicted RNA-binding Zn-ribbon protein involved in translation (DUF1610 family)
MSDDNPYREPSVTQPSDAYAVFWRTLLRRRSWGYVGIGIFPVSVVVLLWLHNIPVGFSIFGASLALLIYSIPGKCPECGKPFDCKGHRRKLLTLRCMNCGISVGTSKWLP